MNTNLLKFDSANTSVGNVTFGCGRHAVALDFSRGNQHVRTEHGSCIYCGKKHIRVIRWATKKATQWRAS